MKIIKTSNGFDMKLDDDDYEWAKKYTWYFHNTFTQVRNSKIRRNKRVTTRLIHRFVLRARKGTMVDHINGDVLDNQKRNLRFVTPQQNSTNRRCIAESGYKGVHYIDRPNGKRQIRATIGINGKYVYLGVFKCEFAAAVAYNRASIKYHGEYGRRNTFKART